MKKSTAWTVIALLLCVPAFSRAQSTIHLPSQGRQADFSGYPQTKPVKVVATLPGTCIAGEAVAIASGAGAGIYLCTSTGTWTPVASHRHELADLNGVGGKQGTGDKMQAFGGGSVSPGDCVQFDASGNVVSARVPCAAGSSNYNKSFTAQTSVDLDHNLGTTNVLVSCYGAGDAAVDPGSITVVSVNLARVTFTSPETGRCVVNAGGGSGASGVPTVFGRSGAVTAQAGDYTFSQIGGTLRAAQIAATDIQGSGTKLQSSGGGTVAANDCAKFDANGGLISAGAPCAGAAAVASVFGRTGAVTSQSGDYAFAQVSGRAGLAQGGTNQGAWTAGRCVQVSADGTQLESAGAPCGAGGGSSGVAGTGLLGSGSTDDPLRVNPATVPSYLTSAGSLTFSGFSAAGNCEEQSMALAGAQVGDPVNIGLPNTLPAGIILGGGYVGAADTVVIRMCRLAGASTISSSAFRATVIKSF
jgi:hypothetical protein